MRFERPETDNPKNISETELARIADSVVRENPLGLLTTIAANGGPRARWMLAAVGDHGIGRLFALTDSHARKLQEIAANPRVCWVFTSPHHHDVVTLAGKAAVLATRESMYNREVAWVPLMHATRSYAMASLTGSEETTYAAIETTIDRIDLISPRLGIFTSHAIPVPETKP